MSEDTSLASMSLSEVASTAVESLTAVVSATMAQAMPSSVLADLPPPGPPPGPPPRHMNSVVGFMIGLGIVTLASIMNAAGLNLTKLDHVSRGQRKTEPPTY